MCEDKEANSTTSRGRVPACDFEARKFKQFKNSCSLNHTKLVDVTALADNEANLEVSQVIKKPFSEGHLPQQLVNAAEILLFWEILEKTSS
jgi:hypothetical protein